jgi:hypothetical protein
MVWNVSNIYNHADLQIFSTAETNFYIFTVEIFKIETFSIDTWLGQDFSRDCWE